MAFRLLGLCLLLGQVALAEVVRLEVQGRSEVLHGRSFGAAGAYEKIHGRVFFEVDPRLEQNRIICDIDLAPRNRRGKVEFSSDFYLVRPHPSRQGQRDRPLRGLQSRPQGNAGHVQPGNFVPGTDHPDRVRRCAAAGPRLQPGLAGLAVRRAPGFQSPEAVRSGGPAGLDAHPGAGAGRVRSRNQSSELSPCPTGTWSPPIPPSIPMTPT